MDTFQQFILTMGEDASLQSYLELDYSTFRSGATITYTIISETYLMLQSLYLPWHFNQFLAQSVKQEIQNLYYANVRNVVVMGLAPLGCAPYYLWLYQSENGAVCRDDKRHDTGVQFCL
ncbi:GDSL esterase/lipase at1g29670 [Phtheirospermum japonicum]|uniref:GDSL esterase/lipase at1g29670 n=1 Tax=Phtheirospermum japonicum TaxID=374723 RepID=A0A830CLB1_9LAMI|nr:GDSL esterase/lipase at1g29670 [Phtheirospermum japonicum]